MLFRFGGEEFVLIAPCPDKAAAKVVFERLRKTVEERSFPQVEQVAISIGAVEMSADTCPITLLDHADLALYHSRHHGRNSLTFFEDVLRDGCAKLKVVNGGSVELLQTAIARHDVS